jgi:hypothetical protein
MRPSAGLRAKRAAAPRFVLRRGSRKNSPDSLGPQAMGRSDLCKATPVLSFLCVEPSHPPKTRDVVDSLVAVSLNSQRTRPQPVSSQGKTNKTQRLYFFGGSFFAHFSADSTQVRKDSSESKPLALT